MSEDVKKFVVKEAESIFENSEVIFEDQIVWDIFHAVHNEFEVEVDTEEIAKVIAEHFDWFNISVLGY